jgi:hypothetical protein
MRNPRALSDLDSAWRLLEQRADDHPLPDLASPTVRTGRRRFAPSGRPGRTMLVVAASAAVVATAVAVPTLASGSGHSGTTKPHLSPSQPAAASGPDWSSLDQSHYLFVFDKMPGTRITSIIGVPETGRLPGDDQYQEVQTDGPYGQLVFKVNAPGAWAPPSDAATTTVNGSTAYYGVFLRHPEIPNHPVPPRWSLAWQYAPDAWVTVGDMSDDPMPLEKARTVAGLVEIGDGGPIPDPLPQDR